MNICSLASLLGLCLISICLCICLLILYRLYLHPLSRIPGPQWAAVSNIWHARQVRDGRMFVLGKTLHQKYGPVVRVGPNEVWVDSKEVFKIIYSAGSGYEKSDFYLSTALSKPKFDIFLRPYFPDTLDLLSERDMKRYRLQRRLIGPIYQTSNVSKYQPAVEAVISEAVQYLKDLDGQAVELKEWMHMIAVECLGRTVLSWSPGLLKQGTDLGTSTHSYLGWRRKSVFGLFPLIVKVEVLWRDPGRLFGNLWGLSFRSPDSFKPFFPIVQRRVTGRIKMGLEQSKKTKKKATTPGDLMVDLIQLHKDKPHFNQEYLRRMAITNFGAGHETLASTLTSIMAMIGSHPDVQRRLVQELAQHPPTYPSSKLPYLQAVIKETKRLHPVLSMSLPRRVPSPGLHIHGYFIPSGTTVGCNPVSLHRNPDICCSHPDDADPDTFDPDRWLRSEEAAKMMERYSLAWGGGARTCPGRHLAEMIVDEVVRGLVGVLEVDAVMPPDEQRKTYFLSMMTGVKARFRERDVSI